MGLTKTLRDALYLLIPCNVYLYLLVDKIVNFEVLIKFFKLYSFLPDIYLENAVKSYGYLIQRLVLHIGGRQSLCG